MYYLKNSSGDIVGSTTNYRHPRLFMTIKGAVKTTELYNSDRYNRKDKTYKVHEVEF